MAKAEVVVEIAKGTDIDKVAVLATVDKFMEVLKGTLAHGDEVTLRGFGTFHLKLRAEKAARNIGKNTAITIRLTKFRRSNPPMPSILRSPSNTATAND